MTEIQPPSAPGKPRSIYATPLRSSASRKSRNERRERARARVNGGLEGRPELCLDRQGPMQAFLRTTRRVGFELEPLKAHVERVRAEVASLERWAAARAPAARADGPTTRRALELFRGFGRLAVLDYSLLPDEARPLIVTWLALEHRWCYAAAGTDREAFKRATGRTGAR